MSKDLEIEKMLEELNKKEEKRPARTVNTRASQEYKALFNSNDIKKGIILSEILGPPKGRRS